MNKFRDLSIRHKLIVILFFVAVFSVVTGFGVHVTQDVSTFKSDLAESARAMARIISDYCVVDLTFEDSIEARKTLSKLSSDPIVERACVYDNSGKLFAAYTKESEDPCPLAPQVSPVEYHENEISVSEPINDGKQSYGRLSLHISAEPLHKKIRKYFATLLLLTGGLLLGSFFLALRLQTVISGPILELAETTKVISARQDYSMRLKKSGEDEIGRLCSEFNNLLEHVERGKQQRDMAENALRESENRYRVLVESSPQAVFLEQEGGIIYANPAGIRLYGCHSVLDLRGKPLSSIFPNWNIALKKQRSGPVEHVLVRSDGSLVPVQASFIVTVFQGKTALQVLAWDITETKNMRQAAERVERLAALGEFSAIFAHEIRNSLGAITLNLKTLSERLEIPDAYKKTFSNMELGTQRIQDIIKGILDFARPAPPSLRRVNLHRLLDNSIHALEGELEQASITLVRNYDPQDPEVLVDPGQIGQVFVNLLLNARHAMPPGGKITLATALNDSGVELKVTDTGKGIAPENMERIFDPFYTTTSGGAGLGLAYVSRILEQHHATIYVESKLNIGTTFTIHFATEGAE